MAKTEATANRLRNQEPARTKRAEEGPRAFSQKRAPRWQGR